jgi:hypothetical protein
VLFGLTAAAAIAGLILFVLTQDLSRSMALFDMYSAWFTVLFVIGLVSSVALFISGTKGEEQDRNDEFRAEVSRS